MTWSSNCLRLRTTIFCPGTTVVPQTERERECVCALFVVFFSNFFFGEQVSTCCYYRHVLARGCCRVMRKDHRCVGLSLFNVNILQARRILQTCVVLVHSVVDLDLRPDVNHQVGPALSP